MNVIWDMTIGEIGQIAGLSTAVVISLILGVRALRQTKELQEKQFKHEEELRLREQRQKLFDEIIDWAIDITRVGTTRTIADMSYAHLGYELHAVELMYFETLRYEFQEVYSRSDYVAIIAIRFTEEELNKQVKAAKSCPAHAIEIYDESGEKIV